MSATPSSQVRPSPNNDRSVQIMAIVVVINGRQRQIQEPVGCRFAAACATEAEDWPDAEKWRRVFVPGFQLLREQLPEPEV